MTAGFADAVILGGSAGIIFCGTLLGGLVEMRKAIG